MPKSSIYPQFVEAFECSAFYRQLNDEEIEELMDGFSEADDDQILEAVAKLKEEDTKLQALLDAPRPTTEEEQRLAGELKVAIKTFDKAVLNYNIDKDMDESSEAADQLVATFDAEKNLKPKKKRFLGLF